MNWDAIQWTTGIFFSLAGAGWIIVELKRKAEEKIIELKDEKTRDIVSDLQALTNKLENLQQLQKDQSQHLAVLATEIKMKFELLEERIRSNVAGADRLNDALRDFVKSNDTKIKNIEHAMANMQLIKIGKDTFMVKNLRREPQS